MATESSQRMRASQLWFGSSSHGCVQLLHYLAERPALLQQRAGLLLDPVLLLGDSVSVRRQRINLAPARLESSTTGQPPAPARRHREVAAARGHRRQNAARKDVAAQRRQHATPTAV